MCGASITGHVFMLEDQPFCTVDCRVQASRLQPENLSPSREHMSRSASGLMSRTSSRGSVASGLYASYTPWI